MFLRRITSVKDFFNYWGTLIQNNWKYIRNPKVFKGERMRKVHNRSLFSCILMFLKALFFPIVLPLIKLLRFIKKIYYKLSDIIEYLYFKYIKKERNKLNMEKEALEQLQIISNQETMNYKPVPTWQERFCEKADAKTLHLRIKSREETRHENPFTSVPLVRGGKSYLQEYKEKNDK